MKKFYDGLQLGILGGGQLGRMLIQAAMNFNLHVSILDADINNPCQSICDQFVHGSLTDYERVYTFGKKVDVLTIEIENVNVEALEKLEEEGLSIYPQARVIRLVQDKGLQKEFFKQNNIPTAAFQLVSNKESLITSNLAFPCVQKLRKGGYDGHGVYKLNAPEDLENAFDAPSVIEEWIDFEKEIAVIVARNELGEMKTYPCVEMEFDAEANLMKYLISPALLPFDIQAMAEHLALIVADKLKIVGLLAVEMLLTKGGELLINELAPRPHNSGHHTIEGNHTSQFEQHLRAILQMPLGDTRSRTNTITVNLLGEKKVQGPATFVGLEKVLEVNGVHLHLYGKRITKPFRKMGHITIVDEDREQAIEKACFIQQTLKVTSQGT